MHSIEQTSKSYVTDSICKWNLIDEKFHHLYETVNDGVIFVDCDETVRNVNSKVLDIFKCKREEIIGKNFIAFVSLFSLPSKKIMSLFECDESNHRSLTIEWNIENGNGKKTLLKVHKTQIKQGNNLIGYFVVLQDITEHNKIYETVTRKEEGYQRLLENLSEIIVEMDLQGNITYINNQGLKLFGFEAEDMAGKNIMEFIHSDDSCRCLKFIDDSIKTGSQFSFEFRVRVKDGSLKYIEANKCILIKTPAGNNIIMTICDKPEPLHNNKQLDKQQDLADFYIDKLCHGLNNCNKEIKSAYELLLSKLESLEEHIYISNISQHVRNQAEEIMPPIDLLSDPAELLNDYKKYIQISMTQATKSACLISNIKKVLRLYRCELELYERDATEIISNSINRIKSIYTDHKITISLPESKSKVMIKGDDLLMDVFDHILCCTINNEDNSEIFIDVSITLTENKKFWKFEFKNNGVKNSEDIDIDNINKSIVSVKQNPKLNESILVVNELVKLNGGELKVEDNIVNGCSMGSNYVLMLPRG
jgi:PAS domain S-box-containing protein